jgi:hypothetical protein
MIKIITRALSVALLVLTSGAALGQYQGSNGQGSNGQGSNDQGGNSQGYNSPVSAPEIDPAAAVSALLLLAGTVAVIRGYRHKSRP